MGIIKHFRDWNDDDFTSSSNDAWLEDTVRALREENKKLRNKLKKANKLLKLSIGSRETFIFYKVHKKISDFLKNNP